MVVAGYSRSKVSWTKGPALPKHHNLGSVTMVPKDSTPSSDFVFDSEQLMEDANLLTLPPQFWVVLLSLLTLQLL